MALPEGLVKDSSLTRVQVESLVSYARVASHEITLKQAADARVEGPVKIGSYYRTVQQGKDNIRAAILTVTIAMWMGFVKPDDLRRLFDQLGKGFPDLGEEERERVSAVVSALVTRIVT
jgi:hypothetical protein